MKTRASELEDIFFQDVRITQDNAPKFILNGGDIDIWSGEFSQYHSKSPAEYVKQRIMDSEKKDEDPLSDVVGKFREKELIKNALLSGSPILFKGKRGYGKTTISKTVSKLLPDKLLAIKKCKIYDDPTHPSCFSCKKSLLEDQSVELAWIPRIWVRIPGDPMLTTRQLIGGLSIQKIREGHDLDDPEVFIPGRALKAHRGVGYFDELGAVPSSLQTLLHELFEEKQVTSVDGDIVPFRIETLEIASTNPANYRGTNPIKEPLLDRMEEIEIGAPESLEEEIEIGVRNMYVVRTSEKEHEMPYWHLKILSRAVRYARTHEKSEIARKIDSEPSCRATIKLFDHVKSRAIRSNREVPLLSDYGSDYSIAKLALLGRIEVEYGASEGKDEIVNKLLDEAIKTTCREIYDLIPPDRFVKFYGGLFSSAHDSNGQRYLPLELGFTRKLRENPEIGSIVAHIAGEQNITPELFLSALEITLHSISLCVPKLVERKNGSYLLNELTKE
ncbi:MAG: ATPase [Candidatus Bathyarchaeia archaeon]